MNYITDKKDCDKCKCEECMHLEEDEDRNQIRMYVWICEKCGHIENAEDYLYKGDEE